jgi:DNA-binding GntR family transcriptional regulator
MNQSLNDSLKIDVVAASVRRQVESKLRQAIVEGRFAPGEHLSDRSLKDMFQVSRTVVREAVRQLEAEGLIETIPHRGSFVKTLSAEEARQIYDVRGVLEALAARGFARYATEEQQDRLERTLDDLRAMVDSPGGTLLIDLKQKFYAVMLEGCGNAYVQRMLNQILNHNTQLRRTSLSDPERLPHTIEELEALLAAFRARDEEAAWHASLAHVRNAAKVALEILQQRADLQKRS